MPSDEPGWNDERAQAVVGCTVLVGITRSSAEGERHEQVFGRIVAVTAAGIEIRREGHEAGTLFSLPPDLDALRTAPPGEYRLRSTGEVVSNPDCLAVWNVHPPVP